MVNFFPYHWEQRFTTAILVGVALCVKHSLCFLRQYGNKDYVHVLSTIVVIIPLIIAHFGTGLYIYKWSLLARSCEKH